MRTILKTFAGSLLTIMILAVSGFISVVLAAENETIQTNCAVEPVAQSENYWPGAAWRRSTPEEQGIDSKELIGMLHEIQKTKTDIHSVLIIRNGYLVSEAYFSPNNKATMNELFSVTKSFNSALIGIAMSQGYIQNSNETVLDIFPDLKIKAVDERMKKLNIGHLLTMSAGHAQDTQWQALSTPGNWVETYMNIPFVKDPGTTFLYDSGATKVLSYIIEKRTGENLFDYARKTLLGPIGINNAYWGVNADGKAGGFAGLQLTTRDMARLGYLYLQNGVWNGKQIVPKQWVEESTKFQISNAGPDETKNDWQSGYGYNWWLNSFGGYRADGMGGQYIFVLPEYNSVVVFTSAIVERNGSDNSAEANHPFDLVRKYIIPAFKSDGPLPQNPQSNSALETFSACLEKGAPGKVKPVPEFAYGISGKRFTMENNPNGIVAVRLVFYKNDAKKAKFILEQQAGPSENELGLDGNYLFKQIEWAGNTYTSASRGYWENEKTFLLESRSVGSIWTRLYRFEFDGRDGLKLTMTFPFPDLISQKESYAITGKAQ